MTKRELDLPYVVGEVEAPGVIERFATAEEASVYIGETFDPVDVEAGRYYIDGPEERVAR